MTVTAIARFDQTVPPGLDIHELHAAHDAAVVRAMQAAPLRCFLLVDLLLPAGFCIHLIALRLIGA